jgi:hypothetical protein
MKNMELYAALQRLNNGVPPKVVNAGEPAAFATDRGPDGHVQLHASGELYAINCPKCHEVRCRLRVHFLWGIAHHVPGYNQPGEVLEGLAYCQNEQKRIPLKGYLREDYRPDPILAIKMALEEKPPPWTCPTMGEVIPLQNLPEDHSACQYLVKRGFSPRYLGETCGAVLMAKHPDPYVDRLSRMRIGFPFYVDGILRLWQARLAYDLPKGVTWPPKWYFPSGGQKVPWNVDLAAGFPVVLINEGVLSAVNAGPAAISAGGKTLTTEVRRIIKAHWKRAFVMFDPDAGLCRAAGAPDYQLIAMQQLRDDGLEVSGAKWTPGDLRDPGDLGFLETLKMIRASDPFVFASLPYAQAIP